MIHRRPLRALAGLAPFGLAMASVALLAMLATCFGPG